MNFGEKLFQLRNERGIYQKALAEYLSVSVGTISNYENSIHYPDLETVCRFAEYFQVSVDYLLELTQNPAAIDKLNVELGDGYTVGSALNIIQQLSQPARQQLNRYAAMLKTCEEMPGKNRLISKQRQTIERQKETIERQAREISRLRELLGEP